MTFLIIVFGLTICCGQSSALAQAREAPQSSFPAQYIAPLVVQDIRYTVPDGAEVFLVWGVDGWNVLPREVWPDGTELRPGGPKSADLMHTAMRRDGDAFIATLQVPVGSRIDYGFLITRARAPLKIQSPIWDGQETFSRRVTTDGRIDVRASVDLAKKRRMIAELVDELFHDRPSFLVALVVAVATGIGLLYIARANCRRTDVIGLLALTFIGLGFRLWTAAPPGRLHTSPPRLIGDEKGYTALAEAILEGRFFESPEATPVYPLFLAFVYWISDRSYPAALYVQAFIGAATIPLTYQLARRFSSGKAPLLAAMLVGLNPLLVWHVAQLYMEGLYTLLLLLTVLCLLWALKSPAPFRYAVLGVVIAVTTLCRPGTVLLPIILPFVMPIKWKIGRRLILCLACGVGMIAVVAPWTYHNYRTYQAFLPLAVSRTVLWHGSPEFYRIMQKGPNAVLTVWDEELNPSRNGGYAPLTIEGDRYFINRALQSIRSEPGTYLLYSIQKPFYLWVGHPAADFDWPFNYDALRDYYSPVHAVTIVVARLGFVLCGVASLVILRHRLRELVPVLGVCAYFVLLHTVTYPITRYSEPLYPFVAVLIGVASRQVFGVRQAVSAPAGRDGEVHAEQVAPR